MPTQEFILKTLIDEYNRVATNIRTIESANDKIIGIGVTIVAAALTYGIQYKINEIFLILPTAISVVFSYSVLQYRHVFWLGGYNRAIEETINRIAGITVIAWEAIVQSNRGRLSFINIYLGSLYILIAIFIFAYSALRIRSNFDVEVYTTFLLSECVYIIGFVICFLSMASSYRTSLEVSLRKLSELRLRSEWIVQESGGSKPPGTIDRA